MRKTGFLLWYKCKGKGRDRCGSDRPAGVQTSKADVLGSLLFGVTNAKKETASLMWLKIKRASVQEPVVGQTWNWKVAKLKGAAILNEYGGV